MEQAPIELLCIAPVALALLVMAAGRIAARRVGPGYNPIVNEYNSQVGSMANLRKVIANPNAKQSVLAESTNLLRTLQWKHFMLRLICGDLKGVSDAHQNRPHQNRPYDPKIAKSLEDHNPWLK